MISAQHFQMSEHSQTLFPVQYALPHVYSIRYQKCNSKSHLVRSENLLKPKQGETDRFTVSPLSECSKCEEYCTWVFGNLV